MKLKATRLRCAAWVVLTAASIPLTLTGCASTPSHESTGEYIDDSAITAKVKAACAKDPTVSAMDVHVETFKGLVQLSGFVDTREQSQRAEQIALGVEGVKGVKNALIVKSGS